MSEDGVDYDPQPPPSTPEWRPRRHLPEPQLRELQKQARRRARAKRRFTLAFDGNDHVLRVARAPFLWPLFAPLGAAAVMSAVNGDVWPAALMAALIAAADRFFAYPSRARSGSSGFGRSTGLTSRSVGADGFWSKGRCRL